PTLGLGFMTLLYRAIVEDPEGLALIAEDESGPVGFVAGTHSTSGFYRRFVRRHGLRAGLLVLPRLLRPGVIRKLWESFRYGGEEQSEGAELLSMAVAGDRRGRGIGVALGRELLRRLSGSTVRVVVGSDNAVAIAAYQKMGFVPLSRIQVHRGESSEGTEWSRPCPRWSCRGSGVGCCRSSVPGSATSTNLGRTCSRPMSFRRFLSPGQACCWRRSSRSAGWVVFARR